MAIVIVADFSVSINLIFYVSLFSDEIAKGSFPIEKATKLGN